MLFPCGTAGGLKAVGGYAMAVATTPLKLEGAAVEGVVDAAKIFSKEKSALLDMAKLDKKLGATREDMQAYEDLNRDLTDPFPSDAVRLDEGHLTGGPHSQVPHGHVGSVDHIPITDP